MFSEAQLAKMQKKKKVSQETFDAAVKENMEEFEMEPEEAVASAIQEFEAQGVDLGGIIKTASGGDISSHPASLAVKALDAAVGASEQEAILAALGDLGRMLESSGPGAAEGGDGREALLTVLLRAEAAPALVRCLASCGNSAVPALPALRLLPALMGASREQQGAFWRAGGAAAIRGLVSGPEGRPELAASALAAAAAGAAKNEEGKAAIMEAGLASAALQLLAGGGEEGGAGAGASPELIQGACALLCAVTNPDDDTLPSSRAFPNARALGKEGAAGALVGALAQAQAGGAPQEAVAALCTALKQVAANEEICKEVAEAGGVGLVLRILTTGLSQPGLARPACSLLRQLASSDGIKAAVVEAGGLGLVAELLAEHPANYPIQEQALSLLTNVTLRQPETAARAVEGGCSDAVLEALGRLLAAPDPPRAAPAVRQACMALRNIAARNPEVRPMLLEKGAEGLLRRAKLACPAGPAGAQVLDAASAALRDLGCDNYND